KLESLWPSKVKYIATYPRAKDCLKNLSELHCCSNYNSEIFFNHLSQFFCHDIQSFAIEFFERIKSGPTKELTNLISVQKNLKYLSVNYVLERDLNSIISSLTKPENLSKLH